MHHAETAISPAADRREAPLPLRDDTLLGVCEALGQDFGIPANLLRIAFALGLLWNPYAIIGAYLGLGVVVAASRILFPTPRVATACEAPAGQPEGDEDELSMAA